MTKDDVKSCFESYAERRQFPIKFELGNTLDKKQMYFSDREFFFFEGILQHEHFLHRIMIKDEYVQSICRYEINPENFNTEKFQELSELFGKSFDCSAYFDMEHNTINTSIACDYSYIMDSTNQALDDIFTEPCYLCRILVLILDKFSSSLEEIENFINYVKENTKLYFRDGIRYIYHGPRYHFEHRFFRDLFYQDTKEIIDTLKQHGIEGFYDIKDFLFAETNLPCIKEYENYQIDVVVLKELNCVHLCMPEPVHDLDCTDILLYYCEETGEANYYTVEYDMTYSPKRNKKHRKQISYFPCQWTKEEIHSNMGSFRTREKALQHLLNLLLNK